LAICLILSRQSIRAQDIHFSQFYEAPLLRNPAFAGLFTGDYRVQSIFRDQWNSFTDAYKTGSFSGEYKMPIGRTNDYFTAGLQVVYDDAGTAALKTTEFLPAFNYHKSLSNDKAMYLSVGFMGGLVEKTIDLSKVTTNNQYNGAAFDPALPNGETFLTPSIHYWDGNLGISFNTTFGQDQANTMYVGASLFHLNRPTNSFYQNPSVELDPKYVFSGGMKLVINDFTSFIIQADHSKQGSATETIGGVLYSYKLGDDPANSEYTFNLGGFLRWGDAFIPVLKLDMNALSVSISYDVNISALQTASQNQGGFELSISYIGFLDRENSKGRILCPKF
jgi:type IX secretion system PorP/SprF family membrane protein